MVANNFKSVKYSQTILTELMVPSYANFGGKVHGGVLLSLMDKVAYVCAAKHADTYCVTASIDGVDFLQPIEVGELVSLTASVNYVGKTSLLIGIKVVSENVKTHTAKHTNTSYFTMVAMDDNLNPTQVPGLILDTEEELRCFLEGMKRKELKKHYREELYRLKTVIDVEKEKLLLRNERCKLSVDI